MSCEPKQLELFHHGLIVESKRNGLSANDIYVLVRSNPLNATYSATNLKSEIARHFHDN